MNINAPKFEKGFAAFVCEGDSISVNVGEITYTARIVRDQYSHIDDDDYHNPDQAISGCPNEDYDKLLAARKAWFEDEWFCGGIIIDAERNGWKKEHLASLWRIECNYPGSDNGHLLEIANELLEEVIDNI